ncbi:MAG: DUF4391 domain-containing protein [Deltaproteobacteria bacterium]|nr:DUF4391 domain-containing protein [Deltaproteobacteria bacterium]
MNAESLIAALNLPPEARVDRRVPKTLLVENGAPTAADKRRINEGIEELLWLAALKPTTTGVPEYCDEVREYLEIAVLSLALRPEAKADRLMELIHRAIPYPVVLVAEQDDRVTLSFAHKRWSQGESGKTVLDDAITLSELVQHTSTKAFMDSMAVALQPRTHLLELYQGWIDCLDAFRAAIVTGRFIRFNSIADTISRREALAEYSQLMRQIAYLRTQADRELQISRRIEVNLDIKRLMAELDSAKDRL